MNKVIVVSGWLVTIRVTLTLSRDAIYITHSPLLRNRAAHVQGGNAHRGLLTAVEQEL